MSEIIAKLDEGDLVFLILAGLALVAFVVHSITSAFASIFGADEVDEDEIADRIEDAIREASSDLLEALTEANASLDKIATSNQAILDDEDADAVRYTPAAPNIGSNLHRMIFDEMVTTRRERPPYAGAPDGLWLHDDVEPAEPVDLTKRPE